MEMKKKNNISDLIRKMDREQERTRSKARFKLLFQDFGVTLRSSWIGEK